MEGVSASAEAVNGVAHSQHWTAVTTRADINLIGPCPGPDAPNPAVVIDCGAHGVAAAPSGLFVVPLRRSGVMYLKPGARPEDPVMIAPTEKAGLNLYRVLPLPGDNGNDLIVCAGRRGGVGVIRFGEDLKTHSLSTLRFDDLDVVDVCALAGTENPRAVAAVGRDGTVILFQDILHQNTPKLMRFRGVGGTVYRILSARGAIFLLTSEGLYVLGNLTEGLAKGGWTAPITTDVLPLPIAAADANLVGDKWLVAVGVSEMFRFDLENLATMKPGIQEPEQHAAPEAILTHPRWQEASIEPTMERMAAAS